MAKKVGVILAGCGVYDGSEIHEAVCTLLALDRAGAEAICMAPDVDQAVVNHLTGEEIPGASRNVLEESARIARGNIRNITDVKAGDLDALIFPGGFGAAKSLCSFATKGTECTANPDVARLVREVVAANKPLAASCIAPALIARILGDDKRAPSLTVGTDPATAVKYQIAVMCVITGSVALTAYLILLQCYRAYFTPAHQLRESDPLGGPS